MSKTKVKEEEITDPAPAGAPEEEPQQAAEFGFVVLKTKEGVSVSPLNEDQGVTSPPSFDDIYDSCHTVCNNINTQKVAAAIQEAMVSAAMQAQGKTKEGLVIPK